MHQIAKDATYRHEPRAGRVGSGRAGPSEPNWGPSRVDDLTDGQRVISVPAPVLWVLREPVILNGFMRQERAVHGVRHEATRECGIVGWEARVARQG